MVISYDDEGKNARLSLRQTEILEALEEDAIQRAKDMPGRECVRVSLGLVDRTLMRVALSQSLHSGLPPRVRAVHAREHTRSAVRGYSRGPPQRRRQHEVSASAPTVPHPS